MESELEKFSHHHLSPKKVIEPMSTQISIKHPPEYNLEKMEEKDEKDSKHKDKKEEKDKDKEEITKLKQKLRRSQNEALKHKDTIKKLNNALKKEIGDDSKDINEIIRDGGSWKGRSEKIAILNNKLKETKRELELFNDIGRVKRKINKNDEHRNNISQMAAERVKQFENAQIEVEKLQDLNTELKEVIKAKNCRITAIESNLSSMRKKFAFFTQKSKTDDSLIETLQSQLNGQLKLETTLNKKQKLLKKNSNEIESLSVTIK